MHRCSGPWGTPDLICKTNACVGTVRAFRCARHVPNSDVTAIIRDLVLDDITVLSCYFLGLVQAMRMRGFSAVSFLYMCASHGRRRRGCTTATSRRLSIAREYAFETM